MHARKHLPENRIAIILPLLLFVLAPCSAAASTTLKAAGATWMRYDSAHFTLLSARDAAFNEAVIRDLERLRGMLVALFPQGSYDEPVPTYFFLFPSTEHDTPNHVGTYGGSGFFQPTPLGNYAALLNAEGEFALESIQRQYLHALLRLNLPNATAWLRHGLSAFYATFEVKDGQPRFGLPVMGNLTWLNQMSGGQWMPLEELLTATKPPSSGTEATGFGAQAWLLVHYLLVGGEKPDAMVRFVALLEQDTDPMTAFREAVTSDLPALADRLAAYASSTTFRYLTFQGEGSNAADVRSTTLDTAAAHAYLGDLVLATQKGAEPLATNHFREALVVEDIASSTERGSAQPARALAHAGLGAVALRAGDPTTAQNELRHALILDPANPVIAYRFAQAVLEQLERRRAESEHEQALVNEAITALENAVEAEPSFAEAWAQLGFARGLQPEPSETAVEALETATTLLPGRADIVFNLLLAQAGLGRFDAVDRLIERLVGLGADEVTLARARETRIQMMYRQAASLVRETRLDEALPLLTRVITETTNPNLRASVEKLIPQLLPVARHNRFAKGFLEALDLYRAGAVTEARDALEALAASVTNERQQQAFDALHQHVTSTAAVRGETPP